MKRRVFDHAPRRDRAFGPALLYAGSLIAMTGCATSAVNPSFPLTVTEAKLELEAMEGAPVELARPVVVAGGYLDPHLGPWWVARRCRGDTGDERFINVSFFFCATFDACRTKLIEAVDAAYPSDDPVWTTEVDVIGMSMGGLAARHAAASPGDGAASPRRLRIRRLFALSSPHQGARMASLPCFLELHRDMRAGSKLLARLNEATGSADYEIYPYVRLGDLIVGAENASPPGRPPFWVSDRLFQPAHAAGAVDARFHADIARRLRGEPPYTTLPAAALPGTAGSP